MYGKARGFLFANRGVKPIPDFEAEAWAGGTPRAPRHGFRAGRLEVRAAERGPGVSVGRVVVGAIGFGGGRLRGSVVGHLGIDRGLAGAWLEGFSRSGRLLPGSAAIPAARAGLASGVGIGREELADLVIGQHLRAVRAADRFHNPEDNPTRVEGSRVQPGLMPRVPRTPPLFAHFLPAKAPKNTGFTRLSEAEIPCTINAEVGNDEAKHRKRTKERRAGG